MSEPIPWEVPHPFVGDGPECVTCGMSTEHECHWQEGEQMDDIRVAWQPEHDDRPVGVRVGPHRFDLTATEALRLATALIAATRLPDDDVDGWGVNPTDHTVLLSGTGLSPDRGEIDHVLAYLHPDEAEDLGLSLIRASARVRNGESACGRCGRVLATRFGQSGRCHSRMLRAGGVGDRDCKETP